MRAKVALFTGCIMDVACAQIHADSVKVLTRNGCEVHLLEGEECCGALLGHAGDGQAACALAQKNIDAFCTYNRPPHPVPLPLKGERGKSEGVSSLDAIVVNAAGCGAYLKKYEHLLGKMTKAPDKSGDHDDGKEFSAKVFDIQEFLDRLGLVPPQRTLRKKVAIQEPCHLVHAQKISEPVANLLKQIPGIEIVSLEGSKDCCGSAGIYNITHYRDSMRLLDAKMERIARTGADTLVAANPGCLFQLRYGVKRRGVPMEVLHPISLLARSY